MVDHRGHRQRMKDRFLSEGMDAFSVFQVLEMLLFFGVPHKDTNGLAHALLERFGSLSGVFNASHHELLEVPGLGPHAATLICMVPGLARRYATDRWKDKTQITDSKKAAAYAASLFVGVEYEVFYMICLDSQNHVIMPVLISRGTINEAMVYPRAIIENALRHKASVVILTHNHPGGSTEPSAADAHMTKRLTAALETISVNVMDHIIIAGKNYTSLAEKRML
ncbi:MAG: DNA repair protein RadC [Oscillospiraceae bacterium]|nr:DNA repair protein RadC [Oscillospiraceae bacterium]